MVYVIEFAESAKEQLKSLPARDRSILLKKLEKSLEWEKLFHLRKLSEQFWSKGRSIDFRFSIWDLRFGKFKI